MLTNYFNENLMQLVFSFLNVKDLANVSCVSKLFNNISNSFNNNWRESCINFFCSGYEQYSLFKMDDYNLIGEVQIEKTNVDWKRCFRLGLEIRRQFTNLSEIISYPNFSDDVACTCEELYGCLKEYSSLPKLRKENLFVENDLNTVHQIHMYDFLYDQQDLYDYYDEVFQQLQLKQYLGQFPIRRPDLPFAALLENFDMIITEFKSKEKYVDCLANLRWYICNSSGLDGSSKEERVFDDKTSIFSTTYTDNFTAKLEENLFKISHDNHLLGLLNSLVLTLTYFCKISLHYIMKYQHNHHLYLDCFIKRYKAYVDAAIYFNEQMENLNVLINYCYEGIFKDYPKDPKFSIYRLMIIIWNREVTTPLTDLKFNKNLVNMTSKIFKKFLTLEVNNLHHHQNKLLYIQKIKSDPGPGKKVSMPYEENMTIDIDLKIEQSNGDLLDIFNAPKNQNFYNHTLTCGLGVDCNLFTNEIENKTNLLDEVYKFEFQAKYFIEQIPVIFLDATCNEYSTFYINDSQFPISGAYQSYEKNIVNILEKIICTKEINKLEFCRYMKGSDLINKFINSSRIKLVHLICDKITHQSENELKDIFIQYLNVNHFDLRDAENFLKLYDSKEEKDFYLYEQFSSLALNKLANHLQSEYATCYFLRDLIKSKNYLYLTIEEARSWLDEELRVQEGIDKRVRKENTRRNILLDKDIYNHQIWNFTPNMNFQQILEIYGCCKNNKLTDDVNMNGIDMLPTFHQTYDDFMDIDMDLKRR